MNIGLVEDQNQEIFIYSSQAILSLYHQGLVALMRLKCRTESV